MEKCSDQPRRDHATQKNHSPIYKKWQPKDHILWPCYMELYPIIKPASNGFMPLSPMLTTSTMRELLTMSWNVTNLSQKAPPPQCEHHNHHWYCFDAQLSRSYLTPVAYNSNHSVMRHAFLNPSHGI